MIIIKKIIIIIIIFCLDHKNNILGISILILHLPFSIPIDLNANNTKSKYSFTLSVYYSDNLRKMHHVILNGTVDIINNLAKRKSKE